MSILGQNSGNTPIPDQKGDELIKEQNLLQSVEEQLFLKRSIVVRVTLAKTHQHNKDF